MAQLLSSIRGPYKAFYERHDTYVSAVNTLDSRVMGGKQVRATACCSNMLGCQG
jgi:hypothetical protein